MPRNKRVWYAGAVFHVMNRGNRRESIFKDRADYYNFLSNLASVKERYQCSIYSICLMTNHFHILMKTEEAQIWKIMQRLQLMYAMDFNRKYNLSGHVFEKRYNCQLVEDMEYLLEVSRYIHLNPVKASIVKTPAEYAYSSYDAYVLQETAYNAGGTLSEGEKYALTDPEIKKLMTELVDTKFLLSFFGNDARKQYRSFVEKKVSHQEHELLIQKAMHE